MENAKPESESMLREETLARWSPLEEESAACAVVSRRMELLYLNAAARSLVPEDWFAKRCWEVFPSEKEDCVWKCEAVKSINKGQSPTYCEETLSVGGGPVRTLGVAVVPFDESRPGRAAALLVFSPRVFRPDSEDSGSLDEGAREAFLAKAKDLANRVLSRSG